MEDYIDTNKKTVRTALVLIGGAVIIVVLVLLVLILALTAATLHYTVNPDYSTDCTTTEVTKVALGLPRIEHLSWDEIVEGAIGQTVEFWSSSIPNYDLWIDDFLKPQVEAAYGITLVRIPMSESGSGEATAQIEAEKAAGNLNGGRVGLIWTNGPDYFTQRSKGLLYGPWTTSVPNAANFDLNSPSIAFDFGQPTLGYEFPYNSAQVVFAYNPNCTGFTDGPPKNMAALVQWVIDNPGKFTYANPANATGDYTGSVFIRHFLYEFTGGYEQFSQGGFKKDLYVSKVPQAFAQLRAMEPGIYRLPSTSVPYYPPSQTDVDNLFATGDICINLSYDPEHTGELIHDPQPSGTLNWPSGVQNFLPQTGTIGNTNYVAISFNVKSLQGALVVANFIGSMAAQYKRRETTPPGIGSIQAYSLTAEAVVKGGWSVPFDDLKNFPETPSHSDLAAAFLPEIDAHYATQMQIDWWYCVFLNQNTAPEAGGGSGAACF